MVAKPWQTCHFVEHGNNDREFRHAEIPKPKVRRNQLTACRAAMAFPYARRQAWYRCSQASTCCGACARFHSPAAYLLASESVG